MPIELNHTIVPGADRERGARFFADLTGLPPGVTAGPFVAVAVDDRLTLDFDDLHGVHPCHFGFLVDDATFDGVLRRASALGARYGSGPGAGWDGATNRLNGGRGVYVEAPDGHSYEFFTAVP